MTSPADTPVGRVRRFGQSLALKAVILLIVFAACPVIVYSELRSADEDKTRLLLESVQDQGRLIAASLEPALRRFQGPEPRVQAAIDQLSTGAIKIKVLFRPGDSVVDGSFFYVASSPHVAAEYLQQERRHLLDTRILEQLGSTCEGKRSLAVRYTNPSGAWELLSSMTPVLTDAGCWVVLTSYGGDVASGQAIARPYWETPEIQGVMIIYLAMAGLVLWLFFSVWHSLHRFARQAERIRTQGSNEDSAAFARQNKVPELAGVAAEFDRMVVALGASVRAIRDASDENAHAFKTPIAIIAQAVEPLRRTVPSEDERSRRAIEMIDYAIERLDGLVETSRNMHEAIADLITPPRERIDLSALMGVMLTAYDEEGRMRGVGINPHIHPDIVVIAGEELLETVIENLLDNAISFAPPDSWLDISLEAKEGRALMTVADRGPGVSEGNLNRIFERHFSYRPANEESAREALLHDDKHYGLGLWIVRRNIEAIGGSVKAENRAGGGLAITLTLPLAD